MIRAPLMFLMCLLGGMVFPWWWPVVPGLVAGFWKPARLVRGFLASSLGAALAWVVMAIWYDARNQGLLSGRIAPLFHLPGPGGLIFAAGVVGGVSGGLGSLFGAWFRRFWASLHDALVEVAAPVPDEEDE